MRFSDNSETPYALHLFFYVYALHPFSSVSRSMVILWILGDMSKIADWRLARADGVVPYYFVIEP